MEIQHRAPKQIYVTYYFKIEPFWKEAQTEDGQVTRKKIDPVVMTETGEIFKFAIPEEVPAKMLDLVQGELNESSPPIASFLAQLQPVHPYSSV